MEDNNDTNSREEADKIWEAFNAFDAERTGHIRVQDLKKAMEYVGEPVPDHKINWLISISDPSNTGFVQFNQFKDIILDKREQERGSSEEELLEAFVAMGGEADGEGAINADKLISTIKEEFGMTIDIEKLIEEIDEDGSGQIEFGEFTQLLTSSPGDDDGFWEGQEQEEQ